MAVLGGVNRGERKRPVCSGMLLGLFDGHFARLHNPQFLRVSEAEEQCRAPVFWHRSLSVLQASHPSIKAHLT